MKEEAEGQREGSRGENPMDESALLQTRTSCVLDFVARHKFSLFSMPYGVGLQATWQRSIFVLSPCPRSLPLCLFGEMSSRVELSGAVTHSAEFNSNADTVG